MKNRLRWRVLMLACWLSAGCASVESYSSRDTESPARISSISVWSGVGGISYQPRQPQGQAPFGELFRAALLDALEKQGVSVQFLDAASLPKLSQAERDALIGHEALAAAERLIIQVNSVISTGDRNEPSVDKVIYGLSLSSIRDGRPLWHAAISLDVGRDASGWGKRTADRFAGQIVQLLQKDGLLKAR